MAPYNLSGVIQFSRRSQIDWTRCHIDHQHTVQLVHPLINKVRAKAFSLAATVRI